MTLLSARFRGDPVLERIRNGDTSAYLRFGANGDHVRAIQFALIDLGYDIPDGATGKYRQQTSDAVVKYKTDHALVPNDPVVGIGTMTSLDQDWALPFADRDEWLSWQTRPIPEFNVTRLDELSRQQSGGQYTFNPLSSFLPGPFRAALLRGITEILDPQGSPVAAFTPSATWGASPLDFYHCHVVVDIADFFQRPSWGQFQPKEAAISARMRAMTTQAELEGTFGTPPWTAAYRRLLLAPGQPGIPSFRDQFAVLLNAAIANSQTEQQTVKLVWHTFEEEIWRPVDVGDDSPRRAWWNDVAPQPSSVTQTPFAVGAFGANVVPLVGLMFVVDRDLVVTVLGNTVTEAAALVNLDKVRIDAASAGLPFP